MIENFILKLHKVSRYDPMNMFFLFAAFWVTEQTISRMIEEIMWGEGFTHWFDVVFTLGLFFFYAHSVDDLAERLVIEFQRGSVSETGGKP